MYILKISLGILLAVMVWNKKSACFLTVDLCYADKQDGLEWPLAKTDWCKITLMALIFKSI